MVPPFKENSSPPLPKSSPSFNMPLVSAVAGVVPDPAVVKDTVCPATPVTVKIANGFVPSVTVVLVTLSGRSSSLSARGSATSLEG